ncbi:STAS domain-containing protein [Hymenobacter weizhouensis]|uniref:STAS domain-containing protein n=1 Tax=Hymenobacter sp. YIM 151500-1 TaxID=2987689 RepID=UPI002227C127|nr:STAS domain-containing protein [Hymenobacter sp. YIM 151500-1]UYZ62674.1 STAS domain-containing protein [Hymenobacter sp. YIM 151500-1]
MEVYREILPNSYLLILSDSSTSAGSTSATEVPLLHALHRASRSGKASIWIDCSHLQQLPLASLRVLLRFYRRLQQRRVSLVLCHLEGAARQQLAKLPGSLCPPVVPSLLDAESYCRTQQAPPSLATASRKPLAAPGT